MGFRCTLTTTDFGCQWPGWFREKYGANLHIPEHGGPLAAKFEAKHYGIFRELHEDIRRCVDWDDREKYTSPIVLVILYECGSIARYDIHRDRVRVWQEDQQGGSWDEVDEPTHLDYNSVHSCVPPAE